MCMNGLVFLKSREMFTAVISFTMFIDMVASGMVLPILPTYCQNQLLLSPAEIGLVFSFYSLSFIFCSPLFGYLRVKIGQKWSLLLGIVSLAISSVIFAQSTQLWHLLCARFLQGAASASTMSLGMAAVIEIYPETEIGFAIGRLMSVNGFGMLLGPVLGGVMYSQVGWASSFYILVVFAVFDGIVRLFTLSDEEFELLKQNNHPVTLCAEINTTPAPATPTRVSLTHRSELTTETSPSRRALKSLRVETPESKAPVFQSLRLDAILKSSEDSMSPVKLDFSAPELISSQSSDPLVEIDEIDQICEPPLMPLELKPLPLAASGTRKPNELPDFPDQTVSSHLIGIRKLISKPGVVLACLSAVAISATLSGFEPLCALYLESSFGCDPLQIGLVFLAIVIPFSVANYFAGWLADTIEQKLRMVSLGMLAFGISAVPLVFVQSLPLFCLALAVFSFAAAFPLAPILPFLINSQGKSHSAKAPEASMSGDEGEVDRVGDSRSSGDSAADVTVIFNSVSSVGSLLGPLASGFLSTAFKSSFAITLLLLVAPNIILLPPLLFSLWADSSGSLAHPCETALDVKPSLANVPNDKSRDMI